ncbi:MAG: hypothetical protein IIV80_05170 [Clostridia bacterium]|nr:hypothetical protein [Clostridia bacterium]
MEPTYTETRSSRPRWSAVDTLIVILVLVALAGIAFRIVHAVREDAPVGEEAMYMVYFTVAETHEDVLDEVRRFDAVYLLENDASSTASSSTPSNSFGMPARRRSIRTWIRNSCRATTSR